MLHGWISAPLTDIELIRQRQSVVQFFHEARPARRDARALLKQVPDMARSLARLSLGRGGPRDIRKHWRRVGRRSRVGNIFIADIKRFGDRRLA